ncbi:glycerol-3-phosphate acyltransferase [Bacteroidota bacterium]
MEFLISCIIGYSIGSFPTAYIILKKTKKIDILNNGSKNVGAMNSYEVSNSKLLGLLVLIIDASKGALSVIITSQIFGNTFTLPALASIFAVLGHCYSPWIKFKGGRGLATAAGSSAIIFPYLLVVWAILWVIFYLIKKDIHFSNIAASIMSVILLFNTVETAIKYSYPAAENISVLILFVVGGMTIILIRHIEPLKELIYEKNIFGMKKDHEK